MTTNHSGNSTRLSELVSILDGHGFSYERSTSGNTVTISIELEAEPFELPKELKPHAIPQEELERYMWKGNSSKRSYSGAELEYAIRGWLQHQLEEDSRSKPLREQLEELLANPAETEDQRAHNREGYARYQEERQKLWDELLSREPAKGWLELLDSLD